MIQFKGYIEIPQYDKEAYLFATERWLEELFRDAAKEMLAAMIPLIPVYSGQARGALLPMARYLDMSIPIDPLPAAAKKRPDDNPERGSEQAIFKYDGGRDGLHPRVELRIDLFYFKINDTGEGMWPGFPYTHPVPWEALETGRKVFKEYVREHWKDTVPTLEKFRQVRTRIALG